MRRHWAWDESFFFFAISEVVFFLPYKQLHFDSFDDFRRHTANNRIWLHILGDYSTCGYNGSITDGHTREDGGIGSYPDVLPNVDGSIRHALPLGRGKVVVDGSQYDVMADECALVDGDATLILKLATHVDEYPFTHDRVLAAVGMEWRKHAYRLRHLPVPKLLQQIVQLLWSMVFPVNLGRYLQCILR